MAAKPKPNDDEQADEEQPVLSPIAEIPWHKQPPLRSTLPDYVAVRIDGLTHLVAPGAAEAFKARYASQPHHDEGFEV